MDFNIAQNAYEVKAQKPEEQNPENVGFEHPLSPLQLQRHEHSRAEAKYWGGNIHRMANRKRSCPLETSVIKSPPIKASKPADAVEASKRRKIHHVETDQIEEPITIQIIIGTYEKVLYGLTATISGLYSKDTTKALNVDFADTFMFNAHGSAIRCLAISPITHSSEKVILASGGSDQIINLYSISTIPDSKLMDKGPPMPSLAGNKIKENPRNRELGSLQHHAGSINALQFPTRSKLLSAAEDNTVAVARTRDWTVLSTIKAPIPKIHGRPSGDTAPSDGVPAGVTHFAVHPSMKLMLSLGKGEKCMRLWNLVTGKKAAVLNFDRGLLQSIGEGKYSRGEGRRVEWNRLGEEFAVAFERGAVVYGIVRISPRVKLSHVRLIAKLGFEAKVSDIAFTTDKDPSNAIRDSQGW